MNRAAILSVISAAATAAVSATAAEGDERQSSPHILEAISSGLPRFEVKDAPVNPAAPHAAPARQKPAVGEVTSLPAFTVRESKMQREEKFLTYKARTKILMDAYMGDSDGLDRGVLNRFTLAQLWKKIPVLSMLPIEFVGTDFHMSAEERALDDAGANNPNTGGAIKAPE
jgi:hypothetical protein